MVEFEISFESDPEIAIVKTRGRGELDGFREYLNALVSDERWRSGMDVLSSHRDLDVKDFAAADIEALVIVHGPFAEAIGPGLCAIVAGSSLKFGLARMFEAHSEGLLPFRVRVFSTEDEARRWLSDEGGGNGSSSATTGADPE